MNFLNSAGCVVKHAEIEKKCIAFRQSLGQLDSFDDDGMSCTFNALVLLASEIEHPNNFEAFRLEFNEVLEPHFWEFARRMLVDEYTFTL
jgi:hypothetical protein